MNSNVQILKSQVQKSVTVEHILNDTHSYCFVYYEHELSMLSKYNAYYVNSKVASLIQLEGYIEEHMQTEGCDVQFDYDYFVLYTNNTEEELKDLIEWLDVNYLRLKAGIVLVTCK
jgi:hypothetical protein